MKIGWYFIIGSIIAMTTFYTVKKFGANAVNLIKNFEGFKAIPYKDVGGNLTIGYGHKILPGEQFTSITEEQATVLLMKDMAKAEAALNAYVTVPLSKNQADSLISFIFNVGARAFSESTLLKKLNNYDYYGALSEFPRWNKSAGVEYDGLKIRRAREQELFIS